MILELSQGIAFFPALVSSILKQDNFSLQSLYLSSNWAISLPFFNQTSDFELKGIFLVNVDQDKLDIFA